jgi:hypothetical protein
MSLGLSVSKSVTSRWKSLESLKSQASLPCFKSIYYGSSVGSRLEIRRVVREANRILLYPSRQEVTLTWNNEGTDTLGGLKTHYDTIFKKNIKHMKLSGVTLRKKSFKSQAATWNQDRLRQFYLWSGMAVFSGSRRE